MALVITIATLCIIPSEAAATGPACLITPAPPPLKQPVTGGETLLLDQVILLLPAFRPRMNGMDVGVVFATWARDSMIQTFETRRVPVAMASVDTQCRLEPPMALATNRCIDNLCRPTDISPTHCGFDGFPYATATHNLSVTAELDYCQGGRVCFVDKVVAKTRTGAKVFQIGIGSIPVLPIDPHETVLGTNGIAWSKPSDRHAGLFQPAPCALFSRGVAEEVGVALAEYVIAATGVLSVATPILHELDQ